MEEGAGCKGGGFLLQKYARHSPEFPSRDGEAHVVFCVQKSQRRAWKGRKGRDYSCAEFANQPKTLPVLFRSFSKPVEQALTADMTTLGTHTSRLSWKWGQENPSWSFSALTGRNFLWLASVAAAFPSLTQDGGQGWNGEKALSAASLCPSLAGREKLEGDEPVRLELQSHSLI